MIQMYASTCASVLFVHFNRFYLVWFTLLDLSLSLFLFVSSTFVYFHLSVHSSFSIQIFCFYFNFCTLLCAIEWMYECPSWILLCTGEYFSLELTLFNIQSLTSTRLSAQRILHSSVRVLDCLNRVKIWLKRKNQKKSWLMCNVLFLFMTFALRKYTRWKHIAMSIQLVRLSFRH